MTATAQVPALVTSKVDSDGGGGGLGCALACLAAEAQPALSIATAGSSGACLARPAHDCPIACRAALASRTANEDLVAVVPGPGWVASSPRTCPLWSMT